MSPKISNITGTFTLEDGTTSEFLITTTAGAPGYHQWGAGSQQLGATVEPLQAILEAVSEHLTTNTN